jgi:hypothetical protein
MGIRTPVAGVRGPHDWPDYTIAANCSITSGLLLHKFVDSAYGNADFWSEIGMSPQEHSKYASNPRYVGKKSGQVSLEK